MGRVWLESTISSVPEKLIRAEGADTRAGAGHRRRGGTSRIPAVAAEPTTVESRAKRVTTRGTGAYRALIEGDNPS